MASRKRPQPEQFAGVLSFTLTKRQKRAVNALRTQARAQSNDDLLSTLETWELFVYTVIPHIARRLQTAAVMARDIEAIENIANRSKRSDC